uniref:Plexin cytoplasmic RasGAP domain-containing protein n=1 Tax=Paramormyrops kingsleyae TaxID=1676925 RepID=A0A3B3T2Y9_9TELE
MTLLNTLKHYKVPDGALIKVTTVKNRAPLTAQASVKDDQNFTTKYCHLIDPDIDTSQRKNPERKKLKLKEINLTKLLSTKVAVHSFVENLFRTIWGTANNKVSPAIKFFFDFLDSEVERKKITDPDVPHIWKTNSLPLRFWVNILKNPQFVFDIDKTPLLDGCLSVIAQTFMDSFSLLDQQLGKYAPTNKLLYVKDIPQYKQEVKTFYKLVKDLPQITEQEFREFLNETAKVRLTPSKVHTDLNPKGITAQNIDNFCHLLRAIMCGFRSRHNIETKPNSMNYRKIHISKNIS